ncbi:MAG: subclass B3 metallo-beta-lactamase, partial [Gemmatimonadales bacterium]
VREDNRELRAVDICSLTTQGASLVEPEAYPGIRADFEHSFSRLRNLRADIFLATHTEWFSLQRKLRERATAQKPADPFIDPDGYIRFVDSSEKEFREVLAKQRLLP